MAATSTLNETTYNRIWDLILSGELELGARLDERDLAERLNVSRTPIREAINRLVQDRVVVREAYRGNYVAALNSEEVSDVYIVRKELEGLAMRLALPRMSDLDLQYCSDLVKRGDEALKAGDLDAYGRRDKELHEFIIEKSDNQSLKHVLQSLSREIQLVRTIGNKKPTIAKEAASARHALLKAMLKRDSETAAALLEQHIEEVRLSVLGELGDSPARHLSSVQR
jgi:DNA-binding GntR family transcriptional regulator